MVNHEDNYSRFVKIIATVPSVRISPFAEKFPSFVFICYAPIVSYKALHGFYRGLAQFRANFRVKGWNHEEKRMLLASCHRNEPRMHVWGMLQSMYCDVLDYELDIFVSW